MRASSPWVRWFILCVPAAVLLPWNASRAESLYEDAAALYPRSIQSRRSSGIPPAKPGSKGPGVYACTYADRFSKGWTGITTSMVDLEEDLPRIEKRVTFELNEWKVDPAGVELLTHVAALVKSHPGFEILIGGHTDRSTGTLDWNLRLSYLRATEVSRLLIERGVPADSLTVLGFGFTRPVRGAEEERTEEQKRLNRRVEFVNLGRKDGPGRSGAQ